MARGEWLGLGLMMGLAVAGFGQAAGTRVTLGPGAVSSGQAGTGQAGVSQAGAGQAGAGASDAAMDRMKKQLADWPGLGRYAAANKTLPARVPGRVVFYGDSITDAWASSRNAEVFFPGKPYVGRGISGQTTPQMVLRFHQDVIALHPEAVVILAGINDVAGNTGPMTPEMTEDNFKAMVEIAKENGIRVILCSILPAGDFPWRRGLDPAPKVIALNAWMKGYAAEQGLTYVDYHNAMADAVGAMKPGLSSDGVHPTKAGYQVMEPLVEAAIERK